MSRISCNECTWYSVEGHQGYCHKEPPDVEKGLPPVYGGKDYCSHFSNRAADLAAEYRVVSDLLNRVSNEVEAIKGMIGPSV